MSGRETGATAYLLREPAAGDVEGFAELHVRVWREAYRGLMADEVVDALSVETFRPIWSSIARAHAEGAVVDDGRAMLVAVLGEEPVGFVMVGPARDEDAPAPRQVWSLNVAPEHQGSGVAQRLLDEAFGDGPGYLWVAQRNSRAIRFYERNGFALDGTQAQDRHDGVTELRMVRPD
ncbi:GNAT family N-acetyltransferase [Ornithinimicrobium avium]|uniref:GNAT family N-acetyltransferase n=1 Tax=Ornithinimicrobium avium TaxID=2283195 RepID=A0A345NM50_9MICO|nr:GNAT family N-acetyltransferase [Ornithinimicrobium avium]AXH96108.1 GNAT family N-acetyltransferase [Ornithinimicrobium avium]